MIEPDMATMITVLLTDAAVASAELDEQFRRVVERTFNCLSIDTDTSTSDTAVAMASGAAGRSMARGSKLRSARLRSRREADRPRWRGSETLIEVVVDRPRSGAGQARGEVDRQLAARQDGGAQCRPELGRWRWPSASARTTDIDQERVWSSGSGTGRYPDSRRRRRAGRALPVPRRRRGAHPRHARDRRRRLHRLGLRPHRRLHPHQRRLHHLTPLPVAPRHIWKRSSQTTIWARTFSGFEKLRAQMQSAFPRISLHP